MLLTELNEFTTFLKNTMFDVAIIMGSSSDYDVMEGAVKVLEEFEISFKKQVVSAHRTPDLMFEFAKKAHTEDIKIIIAGAGGAAHLPGMVASLTHLPVIGVPVKSTQSIEGLDSLFSIVQMPAGVPVATVGVNNAKNAGLLAVSILSLQSITLAEKLIAYKNKQRDAVLKQTI
jgi:5-(carboxyamino)imidazole ribonucleotide mutase